MGRDLSGLSIWHLSLHTHSSLVAVKVGNPRQNYPLSLKAISITQSALRTYLLNGNLCFGDYFRAAEPLAGTHYYCMYYCSTRQIDIHIFSYYNTRIFFNVLSMRTRDRFTMEDVRGASAFLHKYCQIP